ERVLVSAVAPIAGRVLAERDAAQQLLRLRSGRLDPERRIVAELDARLATAVAVLHRPAFQDFAAVVRTSQPQPEGVVVPRDQFGLADRQGERVADLRGELHRSPREAPGRRAQVSPWHILAQCTEKKS